MPDLAKKIERAIRAAKDEESFIQDVLIDALGWEIDPNVKTVEDMAYEWDETDLRAQELEKHIAGGKVMQLQPIAGNPFGIFILKFKKPELFTAERGMTTALRAVLRGLVPSRTKKSSLPSFKREHLLFICTHDYSQFRFAYFKAPKDGAKSAPLAAFTWAEDLPSRTVCEYNLAALEWPHPKPTPEEWVAAWSQAFDVEKVTKRFYENYAEVFAKVEKLIGKGKELAGDELRLFTQTLFNRLMFLRFIERKGWLKFGGQRDYLRALHEAGPAKGKSFYLSRLKPLFFEGLASEGKQKFEAIGEVPFLNGGLFEGDERDKKISDIPDECFEPILGKEGLFYRFNFTVEESTPLNIEVAVDPEMLGKVFEELVTGRHESGSYYTPRPVVSFMCREALKGVLADKTDAKPEAIAALVDKHEVNGLRESQARQILQTLDNLKAVDPACGSGAYLLGLLHEMVDLYHCLQSSDLVKDSRSLYDLKLRIISHNLYGVDIDPFATNIAMLRLWLSLAVDADTPVPLPNLDFKIETGDSLLAPDPQEMPDLFRGLLTMQANALVNSKEQYVKATGAEKDRIRKTIMRIETELKEKLTEQHGKGIVDWRIQFAEAFALGRGGFDIALANPPYVRQELIPSSAKATLLEQFGDAVDGKSDLYCYFYARALQLLRKNGMHVFVCSNSWLDVGFGGVLQRYLLSRSHITHVYDSMVERQFATADVNTLISVISKERPGPNATTSFVSLRAPFEEAIASPLLRREIVVPVHTLGGSETRHNGNRRNHAAATGKWGGKYLRAPESFFELLKSKRPLCRLDSQRNWSLGRGRRTGCDDFFYLDTGAVQSWGIEARYLKPLVKSPTDFKTVPPKTSELSTGRMVFICQEDKAHLKGTNALKYILYGEGLGFHKRNLVASGGRWYDLGLQTLPDLILPIAFHERFFVIDNDAGAEVHQRFATIHFSDGCAELRHPIAALLSSSILPLMAEVLGRRGMGQGVLDFPPEDWREVMIPDPCALSIHEKASLTNAWQKFAASSPEPLSKNVKNSDYRELDAIVAGIMGLDESFMKRVRSDALAMVAQRLDKARKVIT